MKFHHLLPVLVISLAACQHETKTAAPDLLAQNLDTTVNPAADFFDYANGGWIKSSSIPPEESSWGIGQLVKEDIYQRLKSISEKAAAANAPAGSVSQKIGDLWYSGMDSTDIEKQGLKPLQADLDSIRAIRTTADLLRITAQIHEKNIGVLFDDGVGQDAKKSDVMAFQLEQGGLGLPNRDYYFTMDTKSIQVRDAYKQYLLLTFRQLDSL